MGLPLKVLYKDDYFIIVEKPPDLVINSTDSERPSLQKQLVECYPEDVKPEVKFGFYFPHRLDYSTSGVICVALNKMACAAVSSSLQLHTSQKLYLAILRGHCLQNSVVVQVPIGDATQLGESNMVGTQRMTGHGTNSRDATSRVLVLEEGFYDGEPATKVLLAPLTGRRHQLRVHCHYFGHPIIGDYTYSNGTDTKPPRMYLHAYRLKVPNNLRDIDVTSVDPFVEDFVKEWKISRILQQLDDRAMSLMYDKLYWKDKAIIT